MAGRGGWPGFIVFVGAFLYLAAFRNYGFQLEDEGTLLFHLASTADGARPYLDFFTVYTPGFYRLGAQAFVLTGETATGLRTVLALVNAASAVGLYALAVPVAGRVLSVAVPVVWLAALPVYVGEFASFNIPYPAWLATVCWIALTLLLRAWLRGGSNGWLVGAGVAVAFAASFKVNVGGAAGVMAIWVIATTTGTATGRGRRAALCVAITAAVPILWAFGRSALAREGVLLLLPAVAALGVALGPRRGALVGSDVRRPLPALASLALGAVVTTAFWVTPFAVEMGLGDLVRSVLLVGSETFDLYREPYPSPSRSAVAGVGACGVGVLLLLALGRVRSGAAMTGLGLAIVGAAMAGWRFWSPLMPEGAIPSVRYTLQDAALWVVPLLHWCGVVWLARTRTASCREALCLNLSGIAMYWQVYPRTDFMHAVTAMPVSIVLAAALLGFVVRHRARAVHILAGTAAMTLAVALALPGLRALQRCQVTSEDAATRLAVCLEDSAADDLRDLRELAAAVRSASTSNEPVLAFPALTAVSFLAERPTAVPHAWWFPGKPDRKEEAVMLQALRDEPPPVVVATNDVLWIFDEAPRYYAGLRRFVRERYRHAARFGRYDLFLRRDRAAPRLVVSPGGRFTPADLGAPVASYRRQAIRRLGDGDVPALPGDRRRAVRWLRAVRDGGDVRAAPLLLAGLSSSDPRIRSEALAAVPLVVARTESARFRWAGDFPSSAARAALQRQRASAERLRDSSHRAERQLADAILTTLAASTLTAR